MKKLQYLNSKKWLGSVKKTTRRKSRLGYSLIEITIVMALVAGLESAVLVTYKQVTGKVNINALNQLSSQITQTIEDMDVYKPELVENGSYSSIVAKRANLDANNLRMSDDGKKIIGIKSPYDTFIDVTADGKRNFKVTYWELPQDACTALLEQFTGRPMGEVEVNGTKQAIPVKALMSDFACNNSKNGKNDVKLTY